MMVKQRSIRSRIVHICTATAVVVAAGALALPALGAGATTPRCSTAQLRLKFVQAQAATGHRYIDYAYKNVGSGACSLRGYSSAALLDGNGHVIQSAHAKVSQWGISPVRTVVIDPGHRAFFTFTWGDGGFCPGHAFTFSNLRVAPPNNASGFQQHLGRTPTCNNTAAVSAIRSHLGI